MFFRIALAALLLAPTAVLAQARQCSVPDTLPRPEPERPSPREPRRALPIGSYTLAVSWSPEFCRTRTREPRYAIQCGGGGNRFGFTLHGLWPDGEGAQWPQYCRPAALLPERVLRANLCTTPSVQLLQHEWAKHGTCIAGATPDSYFRTATRLYRAVRYPDMARLAQRRGLTVGAFTRAFASANRGIMPEMIRINANPRGWLDEIWICLGRDLKPARCPAHQRGAPASARLRIEDGR